MNARIWNRCSRRRPGPHQRSAAFTPLQARTVEAIHEFEQPRPLRSVAAFYIMARKQVQTEQETTLGKGTEENSTPTGLRHSARLGDNHAGVAGIRAGMDPIASKQNAALPPDL